MVRGQDGCIPVVARWFLAFPACALPRPDSGRGKKCPLLLERVQVPDQTSAAGWGWFYPTPADDSEFTTPGNQNEQGRMELRAVPRHAIRPLLGHEQAEDQAARRDAGANVQLTPTWSPARAVVRLLRSTGASGTESMAR